MEAFDVDIEGREAAGKSAIKRLKREGFIPGVLYGNDGSMAIAVEGEQIRHILNRHGEEVLLNLHFNGQLIKVMVKDVQREPVSQEIIHIDLMPVGNDYLH